MTPRVRTYEEVKTLTKRDKSLLELKKNSGTAVMYCNLGKDFGTAFLWPEKYGKEWRLWEGKPTKKQMKETEWKE